MPIPYQHDTELARLGMPQGIVMRHRPTHFQHLFSGSHYAAGYYVYVDAGGGAHIRKWDISTLDQGRGILLRINLACSIVFEL